MERPQRREEWDKRKMKKCKIGERGNQKNEPRKYETNEICQIMDTQIIGWKRGGYHRFSKEGFGTQRCWIREGKGETETVNQLDKDGFIKLTEGEQMKIPFD